MLGGSLVTKAWCVLGLQMEGWPPGMEGSRGQTTRGGPLALGLDVALMTPHHKNSLVTKHITEPRT
jgi:hypothetical protein